MKRVMYVWCEHEDFERFRSAFGAETANCSAPKGLLKLETSPSDGHVYVRRSRSMARVLVITLERSVLKTYSGPSCFGAAVSIAVMYRRVRLESINDCGLGNYYKSIEYQQRYNKDLVGGSIGTSSSSSCGPIFDSPLLTAIAWPPRWRPPMSSRCRALPLV